MKTLARQVALVFLIGGMLLGVARGAEKIYEPPTDFLKRAFGNTVPKAQSIALSAAQQAQLSSILGHRYAEQKIRYWCADGKTAWILDEIGKTQPITTGFIVRDGKLAEIKVLIYRESHGWEVSRPFFTNQFVGASLNGNRLSSSIDGIVGATLSVRAITKLSAAALYLSKETGN